MAVFTIGELAKRLGVGKDRVRYVVESRRIAPAGRAGNYRLFDQDAADRIELELSRIDRRRREASPCN